MSDNNKKSQHGLPTKALTSSVKLMLRPLVGLLLDNGLTYTWFTKILKNIYVDVAEKEFSLPEKRQTDSRISLLTGVHRKDVKKLRTEDPNEYEPPSSIFIGSLMMAIWTSDDQFLDRSGRPAPLARTPRIAKLNNSPCFDDLVSQVTKNIRPRAVLDEWLRLGSVTINERDEVCLELDTFFPSKSTDEKVFFLGKNIHDHLSAARQNVQSDNPPFVERSVYYDDLSKESVASLSRYAEKKAMEALTAVNRKARELQTQDQADNRTGNKMSFGAYFYSDKDDQKDDREDTAVSSKTGDDPAEESGKPLE